MGEHGPAEPKPGVPEAIGVHVAGRATEQNLHDRHITQSGQQHRADRLGVVDLAAGVLALARNACPMIWCANARLCTHNSSTMSGAASGS